MGLDFGKDTSLICNVCKKSLQTGDKVFWLDNDDHSIIIHRSCEGTK